MKSARFLIPLAIFIALCILFYSMLDRDTQLLPSPLIGKSIPDFNLPGLKISDQTEANDIRPSDYQGKKWLLNIWASWCAACQDEHPIFIEINKNTDWIMVGLNYKDQQQDAVAWLEKLKNPYTNIIHDPQGSLGLDLGVYGVPETFLIDEQGIIRYKHVGPICGEVVRAIFVPFFTNQTMDLTTDCRG